MNDNVQNPIEKLELASNEMFQCLCEIIELCNENVSRHEMPGFEKQFSDKFSSAVLSIVEACKEYIHESQSHRHN